MEQLNAVLSSKVAELRFLSIPSHIW